MAYLLSPMVPIQLLEAVQGLNIVIIILSKVMYQIQSICELLYFFGYKRVLLFPS